MQLFILLAVVAVSRCDESFRNVAENLEVLPDRVKVVSKIVNGQAASVNQFPHQALLFINTLQGTYQCGGSLISVTWVLSAAHCITG